MVSREIKLSVYFKLTTMSDQKSSIKKVIDAAKAERLEKIDITLAKEPPVGEHQSNGEIENTIGGLQGQV